MIRQCVCAHVSTRTTAVYSSIRFCPCMNESTQPTKTPPCVWGREWLSQASRLPRGLAPSVRWRPTQRNGRGWEALPSQAWRTARPPSKPKPCPRAGSCIPGGPHGRGTRVSGAGTRSRGRTAAAVCASACSLESVLLLCSCYVARPPHLCVVHIHCYYL